MGYYSDVSIAITESQYYRFRISYISSLQKEIADDVLRILNSADILLKTDENVVLLSWECIKWNIGDPIIRIIEKELLTSKEEDDFYEFLYIGEEDQDIYHTFGGKSQGKTYFYVIRQIEKAIEDPRKIVSLNSKKPIDYFKYNETDIKVQTYINNMYSLLRSYKQYKMKLEDNWSYVYE